MILETDDDDFRLELAGRVNDLLGAEKPDLTIEQFVTSFLPGITLKQHHVDANAFLDANRSALWKCPVGHGKSTLAAYIRPVYDICYNRNVRYLMVTKAMDRSLERVGRVRAELEHNRDLIGSFGEFVSDIAWTNSKFTVKRNKNLQDPTMTAAGMGASIEGIRVDRAVLDDFIDIDSMTHALARDRSKQWYDNTLRPRVEPGGMITVVGTPWHPDDAYAWLAAKPGWVVMRHQAVNIDKKEKEHALWPERFSLEELHHIKDEIGSKVFEARYQTNPQAIEGDVWKSEWLNFYTQHPPREELERVVQGWDLAISEKETADYTVGVTVGVKAGQWYVLDYYRAHADFPTTLRAIQTRAAMYGPEAIVIESNHYQLAVVQELKRKTGLPVIPYPAKGNKVARLMGLGVQFENGRILIREDMHEFIKEFVEFPNSTHDDILDALWYATERLRGANVRAAGINIDDMGAIL